jgi:ankyrin repeat protein
MPAYDPSRPPDPSSWFNTLLLDAAKKGTVDQVKEALAKGGQLSVRDNEGSTPLLCAALSNPRHDVSLFFVEKQLSIVATNKQRISPLHAYARRGWTDLMQRALDEGVHVDTRESMMLTPFYYAVYHGQPAALSLLLSKGANLRDTLHDGSTALHWASSADVVQLLCSEGLQVDVRNLRAETPLHEAARQGKLEKIRELQALGADLEARDENGHTPILKAAHGARDGCGQLECLQYLLETGADPTARGTDQLSITELARDKPLLQPIVHAFQARQVISAVARATRAPRT